MSEIKNELNPLVSLLAMRMRLKGMSEKSLAKHLGISQSYLSQLVTGKKDAAGASETLLRKCAGFVELPAVICFLLSGRLLSQDFFDGEDSFSARVEKALRVVAASRYAQETAVAIEDFGALPGRVQLLIVLLYETATGTELIPGRVGADRVSSGKARVPFEVRVKRSK
jgi:transcriptional regulator with XRE-family HTH domain